MAWAGWLSWLVTVISLWFIATPWVYGLTGQTGLTWNNIILGAVAAVLSFIAGYNLVIAPERHAKMA